MAILNNSNAITTSGGYDVNNSLRLRASATAALNRTPGVAGNRKTWTWSGWVKRGSVSSEGYIFGTNTNIPISGFSFGSDAKLRYRNYNGSTEDVQLFTTQLFRDPSAWYHIIVVLDTTQATASNRLKFYVNGSQITDFTTATYPSLNSDQAINATVPHDIGSYSLIYANYDGYMAEVHFIDGSAKTPSDFGETDATTGVWKPKKYTGTYGTNGFYLKFSDIATTSGSNAGLGKDFSGNTNYWTTNNISVTAGVTYDAMIDSPTLKSETIANYAVLNPLSNLGTAQTLSDGNLKLTNTSSTWGSKFSTIGVSSGKWYAEFTVLSASLNIVGVIADADTTITGTDKYLGNTANSYGYFHSNGNKYNNGTGSAYGASYTTNDVIGVALDMDNGTLTFYKNGTSQGTAYSSLSGVFYIGCSVSSASSSSFAANFGQRPFSYTPPTGFVRLNTYNLPDSTIKKGNTVMDATTYTGNSSTQTITNAGAFKPDLVWLKCRSTAGTWNNWIDSVRGTSKTLYSNTTNAEGTDNYLSAFNSNGFGLNTGDSGTNTSGNTYVGWQWQAGQGSTSSNTQGSITSTVSVNTTAGFSIVTYTGAGTSAGTVGHGLGVAPKLIIAKTRTNAQAWVAYHADLGINKYLILNATDAAGTLSNYWGSAAPTSTVFGVYTGNNIGNNNYLNIPTVAYCWAEIAGFSKFGSYTGNGSTDGPFVYLGFRPKFILIKNITTAGYSWQILDTARNTYNVMNAQLFPNSSAAEDTTNVLVDYLSNGFKLRNGDGAQNLNSNTYIYMAFAENPFRNSLAR